MAGKNETLSLQRVSKRYGTFAAVDDVLLDIAPGTFLSLLGPSGSGKTTILMMIAGFVAPSAGSIRLGDRDITGLSPEKRDFGMVFQGYALFPTMTVRENIGFALRVRGAAQGLVRGEVDRLLSLTHLDGLGERMPRQLSGGQQQRVALARALIFTPRLLLLDEPLSALDKNLRAGLQEELRALHKQLGTTFIFVTHDQDEALSMSDEIAIVNRGRIVQRGAPRDLYERPASHFAADFLGKTNFLEGIVREAAGGVLTYSVGDTVLRQAMDAASTHSKGDRVLVGFRPEKVVLAGGPAANGQNVVVGTVETSAYFGADRHVRLSTPVGPILAIVPTWRSTVDLEQGRPVWVSWDGDASVTLRDDR